MDIASLCFRIITEIREEPVPGTPKDYINLYSKCWRTDPNDRPDIKLVYQDLKDMMNSEIPLIADSINYEIRFSISDNQKLTPNAK